MVKFIVPDIVPAFHWAQAVGAPGFSPPTPYSTAIRDGRLHVIDAVPLVGVAPIP
jgi:hypothetical protein